MKTIWIIGTGLRIKRDIEKYIKSLEDAAWNINFISKNKKKIELNGKFYLINKIEDVKRLNSPDIIYIAIKPENTIDILSEIKSKIDLEKVTLIIDTPALESINRKIISSNLKVYILEECLDINWDQKFKKNRIYIFYKSFFSYHGIALIEANQGRIKWCMSIMGLKVFIGQNGLAIALGRRDYKNGSIFTDKGRITCTKSDKMFDAAKDMHLLKSMSINKSIENIIKGDERYLYEEGLRHYRISRKINKKLYMGFV